MEPSGLMVSTGIVGVSLGGAWLRSARGPATSLRAQLTEVGWCAGVLAVIIAAAGSFFPMIPYLWPHYFTSMALLPVGLALVLRPRLAFALFPAGLIYLGGYGLVMARDYGFWTFLPGRYAFLPLGHYDIQYYLVLPLAYALLLAGGWLAWRVADLESPLVRLALGRLAVRGRSEPPRALLLLPVLAMAGELMSPNVWLGGSGLDRAVTVALCAAAIIVIRRNPDLAARAATAGILALAIAGLWAAGSWWNLPLPKPGNRYVLDVLVAISSGPLATAAIAQGLVLLVLGLWLTPQAFPQARRLLGLASNADLLHRVQRLTETRAVAVDTAAADLRRLERDLHDGAQARLVALGMNLRAVERLIPASPDAAVALVAEARELSARALTELRELVRGVHPPVLADRGLGDAIRALALDTPMKIDTEIDLPGRLPAPIETACYFAVAEVLTNAVKHSGARDARIAVGHDDGRLRIVVTDFGIGGANPANGSGLAGVEKRLGTFDGIVAVSSPVGGPTMVVMEVPCASSSQKISTC
ncbi:MAG TPA: histidine kinase [Streptosporangiaceae bacterium]